MAGSFRIIFFGYKDRKIEGKYGQSRTTVNYWKLVVLKQSRKEAERLEHEKRISFEIVEKTVTREAEAIQKVL